MASSAPAFGSGAGAWVAPEPSAAALRPARPRTRGVPGSGSLADPRLDLERRLAGLVRSQAPLRRALAAIAGRLVATRAWERLGFARLRDYSVKRLGLSAQEVPDLAHTGAVLPRGIDPCPPSPVLG